MWTVIVLLFSGVCVSGADDISVIKLEIKKSHETIRSLDCSTSENPRLDLNKTFNFSVCSEANIDIRSGSCYYYSSQSGSNYHTFEKNTEHNFTAKVLNASIAMRTKWVCKFHVFYEDKTTAKHCFIDVNVRDPDMGYMSITRDKVPTDEVFEMKFKTIGQYDYDFYDGERVHVGCHTTEFDYYLHLSYAMNANRTLSTDPQKNYHVEMFIKLTADSDGTYVDCNITDSIILTQFKVYRIFFKYKKSTDKAILRFQGLSLSSRCKKNGKTWPYLYTYYLEEEIQIVSLMEEQKYGQMKCVFLGKPLKQRNDYISPWNTSKDFSIILKYGYKENVDCSVEKHAGTEKPSVSVVLEPRAYKVYNWSFITGLSTAYELIDFKKNGTYRMILYQYDNIKKLSLKCYSYYSPKWDFNDTEVEKVTEIETKTVINSVHYNVLEGIFKLKANRTSSVITCIVSKYGSSNSKINVELVQRWKGATEEKYNDTQTNNKSSTITFAICGAVAAVFIVAVSTAVILRKKKQTTQNTDQADMTYENLPGHNEGPTPVPRQWSEVYSSVTNTIKTDTNRVPHAPTLGEMYSKTIPKNQRRPKELQYAKLEISQAVEIQEEPAYATVGNDQGLTRVDLKAGHSRDNYVQVQFQKTDNQDKLTYVNCNANNYANAFDARYANSSPINDYAEPAYCEINVKK